MLELALQRGNKKLMRQPITESPLRIGRAVDNELRLTDPEISRHHCRIEWRDGALFAVDLSSNGMFVNGELRKESQIDVGDRIVIGHWTAHVETSIDAVPMKTVAHTAHATRVLSFDAEKKRITSERIEILVRSPDQGPMRKRISSSEITIGHHAACEVAVADPYVSRRHCNLSISEGQVKLMDLGSTNGTYVGETRVTQIAMPARGSFRIGRSLVNYNLVTEVEEVEPSNSTRLGSMVGASRVMRELFSLIERVGPSQATVLITGESGTGKELAARELHRVSGRSRGPFVAANCGAIPANIIESQLFGHERGAFTGAVERMPGLFEQANGGTLFLDEIGEMELPLQTRLLRVLEEKSVRRVGGQEDIPVDFRLICATNRDLAALVKECRFREDLLYRIFVVPIAMPALRERPEDVPLLARHFASSLAAEGRSPAFTDAALSRLALHQWQGNVRELRNTIERTLLLIDHDAIEAEDLCFVDLDVRVEDDNGRLKEQERSYIMDVLRNCKGNLTHAAKQLGIARTTLQAKVKRYNLVTSDQ